MTEVLRIVTNISDHHRNIALLISIRSYRVFIKKRTSLTKRTFDTYLLSSSVREIIPDCHFQEGHCEGGEKRLPGETNEIFVVRVDVCELSLNVTLAGFFRRYLSFFQILSEKFLGSLS